MVAPGRIELPTPGFSVLCSTDWAIEPKIMAVPTRIELAIFCVTGRRDNRYTTEPLFWLRELDLNQRPLGYEPNELPSCSIPRYCVTNFKWRRKRDSNPRAVADLTVFKTAPFNQAWVFLQQLWCLRPDLNRHGIWLPQDFKSCASTNFATQAHNLIIKTKLLIKYIIFLYKMQYFSLVIFKVFSSF